MRKKTTEQFIIEAKKINGDRYDYSLVFYINAKTPVIIICQKHGKFMQQPDKHIGKLSNGCPKCGVENTHLKQRKTQDEFIKQATVVHGDKYSYRYVEYVNDRTAVIIDCSKHGKFSQLPNAHLQGRNCLRCSYEQRSEDKIRNKNPQWNPDREFVILRHKISKRCVTMLRDCLKHFGLRKNKQTHELLGYTRQELFEHIVNHPNWENVKDKKWHIDHIFPIKAFLEYGITDLKIINALDNLQPLEGKENMSKGGKYDKDEFKYYLTKNNI